MVRQRVVALWAAYAAIAVCSAALVLHRPAWDRLSDLHIYYGAVRHAQDGHPLYTFVAENGGPFTYPPFAALVLWPVGLVPEPVLQVGWLVLTSAAVAALAAAITGAIPTGRHPRPVVTAAVACALLLSAPAQSNLRFGQVSVFVVLLALVDGMGLTPARYRGVLVGVAAAVKLTPLLFLVYFLVAGRHRDAARAGVAFAACAAVGAVVLPADSRTFWTGTIVNTSRIGDLASLGNQSVHGMLLRLGMEPASLPPLWAAMVAAICATALLRARHLHRAGNPAHAAVLVGCATVAASPVSWTHHQIWPVLAAMLLVGAGAAVRRAAGVLLLTVMTLSLGVVLRPVAMTQGAQFLLENARALAATALCLVGFGAVAVATARRPAARARAWPRMAVTAAAALALVAVQPLPAGADPTFKAYTVAEADNPRYFFVCRTPAACARFLGSAPIRLGTARETTKARVNGVVGPAVARLEYRSAPGGAPREIPLVQPHPGIRVFSFRSANLSHGRLVAFDRTGTPVATYTDELVGL